MPRKRKNKSIIQYKLKNGLTRYKFQIRLSEGVTTRSGFISYEEADTAYYNLKQEKYSNINKVHINIPTFQSLYNEWIKRYEPTVRSSTFKKVKGFFSQYILPEFGQYRIDKITTKNCQKAIDTWSIHTNSFKTIFDYTNKIFDEALRYEYIYRNPMKYVELPKKTERMKKTKQNKNPKNFYEVDELLLFLKCAKKVNLKHYYYFEILAFTGARPGEILALQWKDIDFKNNIIAIRKTVAKSKTTKVELHATKTGDTRDLIIDDHTISQIKEWYQLQCELLNVDILPVDKFLFKTSNDTFYSSSEPNDWLKRVAKKYNLRKITPHGFRHTHATLLFNENPELNIKDVQQRLGHKNIDITLNTYVHNTNKTNEKVLKALNKLST